jgi:hypothetical protein
MCNSEPAKKNNNIEIDKRARMNALFIDLKLCIVHFF